MCTATVIPLFDSESRSYRIAFNRDELRNRKKASPPRYYRGEHSTSIYPVDPVSGGTWIGVNEFALSAFLLNLNLPGNESEELSSSPEFRPEIVSRGTIIPDILGCSHLEEAVSLVSRLDHFRFEPFRLVVLDGESWCEVIWNGAQFHTAGEGACGRPLLFTSSGLGDHLVEEPRRELFESSFSEPGNLVAKQDLFHQHRWEDRGAISVLMNREDASTVSHTVVEVGPEAILFSYFGAYPDLEREVGTFRFPRR